MPCGLVASPFCEREKAAASIIGVEKVRKWVEDSSVSFCTCLPGYATSHSGGQYSQDMNIIRTVVVRPQFQYIYGIRYIVTFYPRFVSV